jgi:hypothetical protein
MLILDKMLIGGIKFVLGKVVAAVDAEMNDDGKLREMLLEAQMRHEVGEITDEEFAEVERSVLARIRDIKAARGEGGPLQMNRDDVKVTGIEATFGGDDDDQR